MGGTVVAVRFQPWGAVGFLHVPLLAEAFRRNYLPLALVCACGHDVRVKESSASILVGCPVCDGPGWHDGKTILEKLEEA
jgi:hypothetical protein